MVNTATTDNTVYTLSLNVLSLRDILSSAMSHNLSTVKKPKVQLPSLIVPHDVPPGI